MRPWAIFGGGALAAWSLGCSQLLGADDDVEVLCSSGGECPSGFCGADHRCDNSQWLVALRSSDWASAADVAFVDPDGTGPEPGLVVVVGSFRGDLQLTNGVILPAAGEEDAFVVALDEAGGTAWWRTFGGEPATVSASAVAVRANQLAVVGEYGGGAIENLEEVAHGGFLVHLDGQGVTQDVSGFDAADNLEVDDVALAVNGEDPVTYVVGTFEGALSQTPLPEPACASSSCPGYMVVSGCPEGTLSVVNDFEALRGVAVDATGDEVIRFGNTATECAFSTCPACVPCMPSIACGDRTSGAVAAVQPRKAAFAATGVFDGGVGIVVELRSTRPVDPGDGEQALLEVLGGDFDVAGAAASPTGVYTVGWTQGDINFSNAPALHVGDADRDAFIVTIDQQSRVPSRERSILLGGDGQSDAAGVDTDLAGRVIVAGSFDGTLGVETKHGHPTHTSTSQAVFVARLVLE